MDSIEVFYDEKGNITMVATVLDDVQHCTGDVRDYNWSINNEIQAVFSNSTRDGMSMQSLETCRNLVEMEVYSKKGNEAFDVQDLGEDKGTRYRYINLIPKL